MIIKRVGGKTKIAPWIKSHLPRYSVFVDVFGGSGAVIHSLPHKDKCRYVFNDLDNKLYTFFKVLQNKAQELAHAINLTPYSRKYFDEACKVINGPGFEDLDVVDKALVFMIVNRQSFGAKWTPFGA